MRNGWLLLLVAALACDPGPLDPVLEEGGFIGLAVGGYHSCGLVAGGTAFCWGLNSSGQLGNARGEDSDVPTRIGGSFRLVAVSAGSLHTCALGSEGQLYCWGGNSRGQLGNGSRVTQGLPVEISVPERLAQVSAGWFHTCALSPGGRAYCWGAGGQSQVGGGASGDVLVPQPVPGTVQFSAISAGGFHTCALDTDGRAYCWGDNDHGQLGDGTTTDRSVPEPVAGSAAYLAIAAGYTHTCAVRADRTAVCWGSSLHGELGTGSIELPGLPGSASPVPVHGAYSASSVAAGYFTSCLTEVSGQGWCWGRGTDGQLGRGTAWDGWTPHYILAGTVPGRDVSYVQIGLGAQHGCGLTAARGIYCWGSGPAGQLGTGGARRSLIAVRVAEAR